MSTVTDKYLMLINSLKSYVKDGLIVCFSGGVDSGFLLYAAEDARKKYGGKVLSLTTYSESLPSNDKKDAELFLTKIGVDHIWKNSDELNSEEYTRNDALRCYYCKTELFKIAKETAEQNNCKWIAYGYNSSDRTDLRPGHKAAIENNILYPLAEYEFSKADIRELMRLNNLELAEKPASPCLSSRIMTNVSITRDKLKDIDELEVILREGGLKIFRLRLHENGDKRFLRLETAEEELQTAIQLKNLLVPEAKRRGYAWVTLDLENYKRGGGNL